MAETQVIEGRLCPVGQIDHDAILGKNGVTAVWDEDGWTCVRIERPYGD